MSSYLGELLSFFGRGVATLIQRPTVHGSCVIDRGRDDDVAHARAHGHGHGRARGHAHDHAHDDAAFGAAVAHAGLR